MLQIFRGTGAAIPFLIIRIAYAFLSVFHPSSKEWEPLYGSVGAFVGMALIPEYIVLVVYIGVGISMPVSRHVGRVRTGDISTEVGITEQRLEAQK